MVRMVEEIEKKAIENKIPIIQKEGLELCSMLGK